MDKVEQRARELLAAEMPEISIAIRTAPLHKMRHDIVAPLRAIIAALREQSEARGAVDAHPFPPAAFEEWFAAIEAGDGTIPVPQSIADGDSWHEYVGRRQVALGAWIAATEAAKPAQQGGGEGCNCPGEGKRDPLLHAPNCPARTAPPSAPVGVTAAHVDTLRRVLGLLRDTAALQGREHISLGIAFTDAIDYFYRLAQQPAAVDEALDARRWRHYRESKQTQYMFGVNTPQEVDAAADRLIAALTTQHKEAE